MPIPYKDGEDIHRQYVLNRKIENRCTKHRNIPYYLGLSYSFNLPLVTPYIITLTLSR